ncbi:MAG: MazG nucleotide pyrophosphohydrolase domain-containing protein [Clostridia bacterium]|nr:MazG nucleotide pyrophosphohydrolase domain-containing protein [Clostridia bacterium]MDD4387347.1 MazG nucleotide pyrophosphohydrolase domain-containing protein [Clostridia bacterium]
MKFNDYDSAISDTLATRLRNNQRERLIYLTLGLDEEKSEVTSSIRKALLKGNFHEKELDVKHVEEELGDCLWYISFLGKECGKSLNDLAIDNLKKVYTRYRHEDIPLAGPITFETYQNYAIKTIDTAIKDDDEKRLLIASIGLAKEMGQIGTEVGENLIDKKLLRTDKIVEKLGDSLWYCSLICDTLNLNLEDVANLNISKTKNRYDNDGKSKSTVDLNER